MRRAVRLLVLTMGCACAVARAGEGAVHPWTFDENDLDLREQ